MPKELEGTGSPPQPEEKKLQAEYTIKYGAGNWYDFHCKYWGTKWNSYSCDKPEKIDGGYRFRFDTAWCPPITWLEKTARLFPSLEFKDSWIDESGGAGIITLHGDDVEDEQIKDEEEYDFITKGDYNEVINKCTVSGAFVDFYSLEKNLIERIQDEDLPRFLNFEWNHSEEKFVERIKKNAQNSKLSL